ncbi:MAG TPA: AI-2E family transporter [Flavobacteriales bacterium]|nr:AI-2E family transporter [Flavobacteriales bacterium]
MSTLRDRLLILCSVLALLYVGRSVLVPVAFGVLLAMALHPLVARMERHRVPRALAIVMGLLVVTGFAGLLGMVVVWQVDAFLKQAPQLGAQASQAMLVVREWLRTNIGAEPSIGDRWVLDLIQLVPGDIGQVILRSANAIGGMLFNLFIIPVIAGFLLYDREHLSTAVAALAGGGLRERMGPILERSVKRFAAFLAGMVKVYLIVGCLNTIGLLILGVPNALLFGMVTAVMTIVPYVGLVLSSLLPISIAWMSTGTIWAPLGVVAVFTVVQYLEANIIFPKVVGDELGLNTLAALLLVMVGAVIWGVAGMVLFPPLASILMIVAGELEEWRPFAMLLGKSRPLPSGSS